MSGHSKWHNIRVKKSKMDALKGKLFTRLSREIMMAVKAGGPDPETNFTLRLAIARAREANMPLDSIRKTVERASGGGAASYEVISYEGYGPGGVAILVEVATDNRNRSASEIRNLFNKHGGSLGESGCVAWMFDKKGLVTLGPDVMHEDDLLAIALEAGAEDLKKTDDGFEIHCDPASLQDVKQVLEEAGVKYESAEITMVPKNIVEVGRAEAPAVLRLMEALEDHDDVQHAYANFDIPTEVLEQV